MQYTANIQQKNDFKRQAQQYAIIHVALQMYSRRPVYCEPAKTHRFRFDRKWATRS